MGQEQDKYRQDGVNIELGDDFSAFCGKICKSTYKNSDFVEVIDLARGNFRGPRGFTLKNLPRGCIQTMVADGIGTKVVPIVASGQLKTAASNVIAMTAMDITRYGGLPLVFVNILDVNSLGEPGSETHKLCIDTMLGLKQLANTYGYVVLGGETAELGTCVGSEDVSAKIKFNWGGVMLGVYHPKKMIYGDTLKPGQIIMALQDDFRSNGISSVRKSFAMKYGPDWYNNPEALPDIIEAASPSAQYDRFLNFLNGWDFFDHNTSLVKAHLIVHLSGGAFESKLGKDMLEPQGLSAELNDLFTPPAIMKKCAIWRGLSDEECYRTWNGGQGALVVIDKADVDTFATWAANYELSTKVAGQITKKQDYNVKLHSKFSNKVILY